MHKSRFVALDGLRGIAALAITIYHVSEHRVLSSAWIAVDLFFILSGFVICHSYEQRINQGMSFREFATARLKRLAPLYYIGMLLGILSSSAQPSFALDIDFLVKVATASFFLPNIQQWSTVTNGALTTAFPINGPSWSLFFELLANILFFFVGAKWLPRLPSITIPAALAAYCGLIFCTEQYNAGWAIGNMWLGLLRIVILFYVGAGIYKGINSPPRFAKATATACIAAFFAIMALRSKQLALFASVFLSPFVIHGAKDLELHPTVAKIGNFLGDLSYPLYITHFPVYKLLCLVEVISNQHLLVRTAMTTCVCLGLAGFFNNVDKRIRRRLQ